MSSDVHLIRAHFESALHALSRLNDFSSVESQDASLEEARLAYRAGLRQLRQLRRVPREPELTSTLDQLQRLEERVRHAMTRAEAEELTTPYFMTPAH